MQTSFLLPDQQSQNGNPAEDIRELIHIAHEEGFAVMAHANGARTMEAAAQGKSKEAANGCSIMFRRESLPRQVYKKFEGAQGERGLEFSRRKKGQTFFSFST